MSLYQSQLSYTRTKLIAEDQPNYLEHQFLDKWILPVIQSRRVQYGILRRFLFLQTKHCIHSLLLNLLHGKASQEY